MFKSFIKQLMHYFPAQIAPAIINLAIIMILTRAFTVEMYGDYVLVTTIITFAVTILTQWLVQAVLYYRPRYIERGDGEEFNQQLSKIIHKFILLNLVIILILVTVSIFTDAFLIYILAMTIILFHSIFTIEQVVLQSDMNPTQYTKRVFISNMLRLVGVLLFALYKIDITAVLFVILISYAIFVLPKLKMYLTSNSSSNISTKEFIASMLTYGLPMLGWSLSIFLMSAGDRFLIKYLQGSEAVGLYSGNYSIIAAGLSLVFAPLMMVIHPMLMKLNVDEQKDKIESLISKFTTISFIIGMPIILLVYKFREDIAYLVLGEQYVEASNLIPVVMLGIFLWNLAMVGHKGMEIINKTKMMFYFAIITCMSSFAINIILIERYSYIGAAYGNLIAFCLYCFLVYIYSLKSVRWLLNIKEISLILCCAIVMFTILNLFTVSIQGNIISGIVKIAFISLGTLIIYIGLIIMMMKKQLINIKF